MASSIAAIKIVIFKCIKMNKLLFINLLKIIITYFLPSMLKISDIAFKSLSEYMSFIS